jgi:hypothetical protein
MNIKELEAHIKTTLKEMAIMNRWLDEHKNSNDCEIIKQFNVVDKDYKKLEKILIH